jgi:predicted outer membrane protein
MNLIPLFCMIPNHFNAFSMTRSRLYSCVVGSIVLAVSASTSYADDSFSAADKAFVAKVSQGGMFEVELAKVAETKATTQGSSGSSEHRGT